MPGGGLFFEGVDGESHRVESPEIPRYVDEMRASIDSSDPALTRKFDVDQVGRWALVTGVIDELHDGHPGTAVHLFMHSGRSWIPTSGSTGTFSPSWERRRSGAAVAHHASGGPSECPLAYVVVDVRRDVAYVRLDRPEASRLVDTRSGPGLVGMLYAPTEPASVAALGTKDDDIGAVDVASII